MNSQRWNNKAKIEQIKSSYTSSRFTPEQRRCELAIDFIRKRLGSVRSLLDCGCGTGMTLRRFKEGLNPEHIYACDFSDEMIAVAKENAKQLNDPNIVVFKWDLTEPFEYSGWEKVDCITLLSVLPYIRDKDKFYAQLPTILRTEGLFVATFPNKLFDLFSLNSYTKNFILWELIAPFVDKELLAPIEAQLDDKFRNKPVFQEYSAYKSATYFGRENPLELPGKLEQHGIHVEELRFMHHHCVPPPLEAIIGDEKVSKLNERLERDSTLSHWSQYFTNSTFMVCGKYVGN